MTDKRDPDENIRTERDSAFTEILARRKRQLRNRIKELSVARTGQERTKDGDKE
jgi:hypothetical protein